MAPNDKNNKFLETIILLVVFVLAFLFLDKNTNIFNNKNKILVADVPDKAQPIYDGTGGEVDPKVVDLVTSTVTLHNLFDPKIYSSSSIDVAFKGDFDTVELHVEGNISNDLKNFLFIGFGTINGTYGVDRINSSQIQYDPDSVFTKDKPLNLSIDLMSQIKLSNSSREVAQGSNTSKSRRLWDFVQPPVDKNSASKVNLVVGVYNENGNFDSQITKLQILYRCKESDPNCEVNVCPKGKYPNGSTCLDNLFGKGSGKKYGKVW